MILMSLLVQIQALDAETDVTDKASGFFRWFEDIRQQFHHTSSHSEHEHAERQLLDITFISYSNLTWHPPLDASPPGAIGSACLYAGTNYTMWRIETDVNMTDGGRLRLVRPDLQTPGAPAGHCLRPEYNFVDVLPPLDGSRTFQGNGTAVWYDGGIYFPQGGLFKLCYSPLGTFADPLLKALGDAALVPNGFTTFRVLGAQDTCNHGPGCLLRRRFFCHIPHKYYVHYLPTDLDCNIFFQSTSSPLLYSRLAVMENTFCGLGLGAAMQQNNGDGAWARVVDPVSLIDLGKTRTDLTEGFRYRLCFCPAFDGSEGIEPVIDGVCGQNNDFVQQVGVIDGLMASFLDVSGEIIVQTVPMTRFSMRVDCGGGHASCPDTDYSSIKVIDRTWGQPDTPVGFMHWNVSNTCPEAVEAAAWYSPPNCQDASGARLFENCQAPGGTSMVEKLFGVNETRFQAAYGADDAPIAQVFDVCFVHKDPAVDNLNISLFKPYSDDALQETSRMFFKVGQIIVEPLLLYNTDSWVMTRPNIVRIGPPDLTKSSNLHESSAFNRSFNGTNPVGPMIKVIAEGRGIPSVMHQDCLGLIPDEADVTGLLCANQTFCTPRATKTGEELILDGGNPDHRITVMRGAIVAVCYCEAWTTDPDACQIREQWMLVGKFAVSGPVGTQEWTLDRGMIQSFEIKGFNLKDRNVVRILESGYGCDSDGYPHVATFVKWCSAANEGRCVLHGDSNNDTHVFDIPGSLWRWNSTDPPAYIAAMSPALDSRGGTFLDFPFVPLIKLEDRIHIEPDSIIPKADHWVRQRDLARIIKGQEIGHEALELSNADRRVRIGTQIDPYPELEIVPPEQGKWYRSNTLKIPDIKGTKEISQLAVCWGDSAGDYYAWAGYINFVNPNYLDSLTLGLTTTAVGRTAPIVITFKTGDNPQYLAPIHSMQLRLTFTNTTTLAPAYSTANPELLSNMKYADQTHEASQSVCGRLFLELYSDYEFGFPVPKGCYVDMNRYGSKGRIQAIYMLFEPLNGLRQLTTYHIVMNAKLGAIVETMADYSKFEEGLIELATLDDIKIKPEGIVDVGWANPDKTMQQGASHDIWSRDQRWYQGGIGGISLLHFVEGELFQNHPSDDVHVLDVWTLRNASKNFGLGFLIRGEDTGKIIAQSVLRIYMYPLTVWAFNYRGRCSANLVGTNGSRPPSLDAECKVECAMSKCEDFIPPLYRKWLDSRGRDCTYYEEPGKCLIDGESYTPAHGYSAKFSCCVCDGGVRANANIVKIKLPSVMEPAYSWQKMSIVRFWDAFPVPRRGFFPMRLGSQISTPDDNLPDYTVVTGHYIMSSRPEVTSPVSSLIGIDGWGNNRQFSADLNWNDIYLRLQLPLTLRGADGTNQGEFKSTASMEIVLPEGYECKKVDSAYPPGEGPNQLAMPWLPSQPPQGSGILPASSERPGGNLSAPSVVSPSGDWVFVDNKCIFHFSPHMTLWERQRIFLYIWAKNPVKPMPKNDPSNTWKVILKSSGDWGEPINHSTPCCTLDPCCPPIIPHERCRIYPPYCNDTGEQFFVQPIELSSVGNNPLFITHGFEPLFPTYIELATQDGPTNLSIGTNESEQYTESYAVLGILRQTVYQPLHLVLATQSSFRLWFRPELGADRGGYLGVHAPEGFDFGSPCRPRDLPSEYYSIFSAPFGVVPQRVWPIEDMGQCYAAKPPSWHKKGTYVVIEVAGSMIPGRLYGLEIDVANPPLWSDKNYTGSLWSFDMSITDGFGYGRDSTYNTTPFHPDVVPSWPMYKDTPLISPIHVDISSMLPYEFTDLYSRVIIGPILLNTTVVAQFRITAPMGYQFEWDAGLFNTMLPTQDAPLPGGAPTFPDDRRHVVEWNTFDKYVEQEKYYAVLKVKIPEFPNITTGQSWWFEWGFNESDYADRPYATRSDAKPIRALRNAKVESSDIVKGHKTTIWLFVETVTAIGIDGSLEVIWPFHEMAINGYLDEVDDFTYITIRAATDYGSKELPRDMRCRLVKFPAALITDGNWLGAREKVFGQLRLEFRANRSGIEPGLYVFEINATNPPDLAVNPPKGTPCSYKGCLTWMSKTETYGVDFDRNSSKWEHVGSPNEVWQTQNDYYTTIPSQQIANPMVGAMILNLTLDQRLACGRDDRPLKRSALVMGFSLSQYIMKPVDELHIRGPVGWEFDSDCDVWTRADEVYPPPAKRPSKIPLVNGSDSLLVSDWPESATIISCRGDGHNAIVKLRQGLLPQRVYLFRIGIKRNPKITPFPNSWSITLGWESSGAMPGFPVWTFPGIRLAPVLLAWSNKTDPVDAPIAIYFQPTRWLCRRIYLHETEYPRTDYSTVADLDPLLRVVMPPQFEFLVDAEDQDMQGQKCYLTLQLEGSCRLCGVPITPPTLISCRREWNRKNAALVTFDHSFCLDPNKQYSMWISVINPHTRDAVDGPVRDWMIESFQGKPAPPAVAPKGYWLDQVAANGFRITGRAKLTIQEPDARDGGSTVDFQEFSMQFPDLLKEGDTIEIKAPIGFMLSYVVRGLNIQRLCYGFEWLPTIWPDPLPPNVSIADVPEHLIPIRPPVRPPLPKAIPPWADGMAVIEIEAASDAPKWAAGGAWVMRMPVNFTAVLLNDYQKWMDWINATETNGTNVSNLSYIAPNAVQLMQSLGLPDWAVPAAAKTQLETQGNETVNATMEFMVLRDHCMHASDVDLGGKSLVGVWNWSRVPLDAAFSVSYEEKRFLFKDGVPYLPANASNSSNRTGNFSADEIMGFMNVTNGSNMTNLTGFEIKEEVHLCLHAVFAMTRMELDPVKAEEECTLNCSKSAAATRNDCMVNCLFVELQNLNITRCTALPPLSVPARAVGQAAQLLPTPRCASKMAAYLAGNAKPPPEMTNWSNGSNGSNGSNRSNLNASNRSIPPPYCPCGMPGDFQMAVLWRSPVNLASEVEAYRLKYQAAQRLLSLDRTPLQAPPYCEDEKLIFRLTNDTMHPDPTFLNHTVTFRFRMRYQNPRRPPLDHQNYWVMQHRLDILNQYNETVDTEIYSSAARKSWKVFSKLRYVTIERLTEVLRPTDPATLHFEFVTVNPAEQLTIIAEYPEGFDFTTAYRSSTGTYEPRPPTVGGRRLLWQGFTPGIEVMSAKGNTILLSMSLDKIEYVRFRLSGVLIPWTGGQALFSLYTSIGPYPRDEMVMCCQEGEPKHNPAFVFRVPFRLQNLRGVMLNEWHQEAFNFPIASTLQTRLDEYHKVKFTFLLDADLTLYRDGKILVVIVRAPVGYVLTERVASMDIRDSLFMISDPELPGDGLRMRSLPKTLRKSSPSRLEIGLPGRKSLSKELEYQVIFEAMTPQLHSERKPNDLWVLELTDDWCIENNEVAMHKGSFDDFTLLSKVNFTCAAPRSPPEVIITIEVTIFALGEPTEYPNRIDVYAPPGYKFLLNCFAEGESTRLQGQLVSCRERWTLFNGNYLSGAILMAADNGIRPELMPFTVRLQSFTPALTPFRNDFFIRTRQRLGPAAWGMVSGAFPISNMQVTAKYPGVSGTIVPMFLALVIRYPIPWGGYIHLAAPRTYQSICPITKVLTAPEGTIIPECLYNDPLLNGCYGLPQVGDPKADPLLPLCDPKHEILLHFKKPEDGSDSSVALAANSSILWSIDVQVPVRTPRPRSSNVFRVRTLDANKVPMDGNLWLPGQSVRTVPVAGEFQIWFTRPVPSSLITVAIQFVFNSTTPRELEERGKELRVIEIMAPEGLEIQVRRPRDVTRLTNSRELVINAWNWTNTLTRQLWFGLDIEKNVTGKFHFAFPVLTPSAERGMPYNNLWDVKFCADSPYCNTQLLSVPIPGFFFGEEPEAELSSEAKALLTGSGAIRRAAPSVLLQRCMLLALLLAYSSSSSSLAT